MGAIKNVDYDADFNIDESLSGGDEVYFIVAIQPVDSAEKLFFTVRPAKAAGGKLCSTTKTLLASVRAMRSSTASRSWTA